MNLSSSDVDRAVHAILDANLDRVRAASREAQLVAQLRGELRKVIDDALLGDSVANVNASQLAASRIAQRELEERLLLTELAWHAGVEFAIAAQQIRTAALTTNRVKGDFSMQTEEDGRVQALKTIRLCDEALAKAHLNAVLPRLQNVEAWQDRARHLQLELTKTRLHCDELARAASYRNAGLPRLSIACGGDNDCVEVFTQESQTADFGLSSNSSDRRSISHEVLQAKLDAAEATVAVLHRRILQASAEEAQLLETELAKLRSIRQDDLTRHRVEVAAATVVATKLRSDQVAAERVAEELRAQLTREQAARCLVDRSNAELKQQLDAQSGIIAELRAEFERKSAELSKQESTCRRLEERISGFEYLAKTRDRTTTRSIHENLLADLQFERYQIAESDKLMRAALEQLGDNDTRVDATPQPDFLIQRARRLLKTIGK